MSRRAILGGALLLASVFPATAAAPPKDDYSRLIYDYEVALICGLGGAAMQQAYKQARARLEAASPLDAEELTRRRVHAMAAAEIEYNNRGLGGYRPWCRTEGRSGVDRIMRAAQD